MSRLSSLLSPACLPFPQAGFPKFRLPRLRLPRLRLPSLRIPSISLRRQKLPPAPRTLPPVTETLPEELAPEVAVAEETTSLFAEGPAEPVLEGEPVLEAELEIETETSETVAAAEAAPPAEAQFEPPVTEPSAEGEELEPPSDLFPDYPPSFELPERRLRIRRGKRKKLEPRKPRLRLPKLPRIPLPKPGVPP